MLQRSAFHPLISFLINFVYAFYYEFKRNFSASRYTFLAATHLALFTSVDTTARHTLLVLLHASKIPWATELMLTWLINLHTAFLKLIKASQQHSSEICSLYSTYHHYILFAFLHILPIARNSLGTGNLTGNCCTLPHSTTPPVKYSVRRTRCLQGIFC